MDRVVRAKVIAQKGLCSAGHRIGDEVTFDWEKNKIIGHECLHTLYSKLHKIYALAHGADIIYTRDEAGNRVARHACPDGANPVIFELSRE